MHKKVSGVTTFSEMPFLLYLHTCNKKDFHQEEIYFYFLVP